MVEEAVDDVVAGVVVVTTGAAGAATGALFTFMTVMLSDPGTNVPESWMFDPTRGFNTATTLGSFEFAMKTFVPYEVVMT